MVKNDPKNQRAVLVKHDANAGKIVIDFVIKFLNSCVFFFTEK
jgi:hypothetical protein